MKALLALSVAAVLVGGCGELPDPSVAGGNGNETADDGKDNPDSTEQGGDKDVPPPEAPSVGSIPSRYGYATIPIRGTASAYETIFVEGGEAPVATDADANGAFCIDIPLEENQDHTLEIFAQDQRGETSEPSVLEVFYDPALAETTVPQQPLVALAGGLPAYSDQIPKENTLANLTDEDPTTDVLVMRSMVWIDLQESYDLESIEIQFPDSPGNGDDTFATEYLVLASHSGAPVLPPDAESEDWTVVRDVFPGSGLAAGDGGVDHFDLETPLRARFVAFYLIENNKTDWLSTEDIRVSEIRIAGRASEQLPEEPLTPTCANGRMP